jgi:hypothetical protein
MKKTFRSYIAEMPIDTYDTIGNFDKAYSFKKPVDRKIVTNPVAQEKLRQKFENTDAVFNLFMVNTPEAKQYAEVGIIDPASLHDMLGQEVADRILPKVSKDAINVIFTNNSGSEHVPLTGWMVAHRIGHSLSRQDFKWNSSSPQFRSYRDASSAFVEYAANILKDGYGLRIKDSPKEVFSDRPSALAINRLFQHVCTFRSARNGDVRDWFEYINEMFAQHITTSTGVHFNPLPATFKVANRTYHLVNNENDREYLNGLLESLQEVMSDNFEQLLNESTGKLLLM